MAVQPPNATVRAGATATFTAPSVAGPAADLRHQWLRNGTPIPQATGAVYTTEPLATTDDGTRYAVTVTGPSGSTTSTAATLSVRSSLAGRAWTAGTRLSAGPDRVTGFAADIADDGTVWAVLGRATPGFGGTGALEAIRLRPAESGAGATAGHHSESPAERIDAQVPTSFGGIGGFGVSVSPKGSVLVHWIVREPCNARRPTFSAGTSPCWWLYATRRLANATAWEPARPVTALPISGVIGRINDAGNVALAFTGWTTAAGRTAPDLGEDLRLAVARWPAGSSAVSITPTGWKASAFTESTPMARLGIDGRGVMTLVAESYTTATARDIVSWRASNGGALEGPEILDRRTDDAVLGDLVVGTRGDAVVYWIQNDGRTTRAGWVATRRPDDTAWTPRDGDLDVDAGVAAVVGDDGWIRLMERLRCRSLSLRPEQVTWSPPVTLTRLPSGNCPFADVALPAHRRAGALARDGNYLIVQPGSRRWLTGDGGLHRVIKGFDDPAAAFVVGTSAVPAIGIDAAIPLLSRSGVGAWVVSWPMTTLPSASQPRGEVSSRPEVWALFLQ